MGNYSTYLMVLVFMIIALTVLVVMLALVRELLFWYWRTKGVMHRPKDPLATQDTAIIMRDSMAEMRAQEISRTRKALADAARLRAAEKHLDPS